MKNSIVIFLSIISSILLLNGCSQNTKKEVKETKIKTITIKQFNRVSRDVVYSKVTTCNFDTLGRITDSTITHTNWDYFNGSEEYAYSFAFSYDQLGNLVELSHSYLKGDIISRTTYKYDENKNILEKDFQPTLDDYGSADMYTRFLRIDEYYHTKGSLNFYRNNRGDKISRVSTEYSYEFYK